MSDDRKLLELAAKAAGYHVMFDAPMSMTCEDGVYYTHERGWPARKREGNYWWNPLLNDGDALRLCGKLRKRLMIYPSGQVTVEDAARNILAEEYGGTESDDAICAAARRAIVRAAAAIGESMP